MSETAFGNKRGVGSVQAAISRYGGKINQSSGVRKNSPKDAPDLQERESRAQELHIAKTKVDKINEGTRVSETVKSQAELELLKAKEIVRELTAQIEESKAKAKQKTEEIQSLDKLERFHDKRAVEPSQMDQQHEEVMGELENLKREVSKIKLDMARVLVEKSCAEEEAEAAGLKLRSFMNTAEKLSREVEEANEEEVLVELAQIQARKELAAIEAQMKQDQEEFLSKNKEIQKKIEIMRNEVEQAKQLENDLAITIWDADMLQNELKMIKELDKGTESSVIPLPENSELQSVTKDLTAAKAELESIKAGSFKLMGSMDVIRIELDNLLKEKDHIERKEAKTDKFIEKLSSKLLRAKNKLETTRESEEKAKPMLSSFDHTLHELQKEKEAADKEKKCITEEIASIKDDIHKTESATDSTEDRLWATMEELEAVKRAEENALKKLKAVAENSAIARASKKETTITISKFEFQYLTGCAIGAEELAGKKAAAAHAWAEALRANEKEIHIKTALAERKIKELRDKEKEFNDINNSVRGKEVAETDIQHQIDQGNKIVRGRKSTTQNSYSLTPARQTNFRKSIGSPAARRPIIATPLTVKRKKKAVHKLTKYFASNQIENEKSVPLDESE